MATDDDEIIEGMILSIGSGENERYDFVSTPGLASANIYRQMSQKGIQGSNQSDEEIGNGNISSLTPRGLEFIEPPYHPQHLADLLEENETHYRAVKAKVSDMVSKPYTIKSYVRVLRDIAEAETLDLDPEDFILATDYRKEVRILEKFIEKSNPQKGFLGTLQCAAMDFEAVGWGAIEVIRAYDMRVLRVAHVPAARIRVLKGHKGYVELRENTSVPYRYYQNFGEKVGKRRESPLTGRKEFVPFDPDEDSFDDSDLVWNLLDRERGEKLKGRSTANLAKAANELIFIPKFHPNTIYYGYSDIIPAIPSLIINAHIKKYQAQFFENNAVPRYAVIVTGGTLSDELKKALVEYFTNEVKGQAHKTLVLCLPSNPTKEIKVEFKQIDGDHKEADFILTEGHNQRNIQVAHGTPPAILGVAEHSELGSGKGLSQAELYKDRIVLPSQYFWQEKLYELTSKGLGVTNAYIGFSPFDVRDLYTQMQIITGLIDRGVFNTNDGREALDKPPITGGDVHFVKGDTFIKISDLVDLDSTVVQPGDQAVIELDDESGNNSQQPEAESDNVIPPTE